MLADELFNLSGKVAMVTGGSRGLGFAMVRAFARYGADVVIISRKKESCDSAAEEVRAMGRRALAYGAHVGHWDELPPLVEVVYETFGRVDILVNNAGMAPLAPSSLDTTEELFNKVVGVNFKGPFRLCALVGSRMYAGEGGTIINVSSTGSLHPNPRNGPYAGAKAALNTLAEVFSKEFAPKVRVNTLVPGPFLTDIAKSWSEDARTKRDSPSGRIGRPEEIVTAALYLASAASSFTYGSMVRVDGGAS